MYFLSCGVSVVNSFVSLLDNFAFDQHAEIVINYRNMSNKLYVCCGNKKSPEQLPVFQSAAKFELVGYV